MTERKRKTKLDFMGYARVSGALPVDLGRGPLADERMQQLALPEGQWMGGGDVDQALSDLSRKFMAEVDAGLVSNSKCNTNRIGCCYEKTIQPSLY